ncbi:MAG: sensor domain-containing diguanylate cyclase [Gammaproteobacteria bacterium]|nr:sensor domain-containing diguanylate cyclase [Gammaproteobacteria bacterium]
MGDPNTTSDETLRLQTLNSLKILDTPQEARFDRITKLAQRLLDVPVALFSLVDEDRIWFKSRQGLESAEIPRQGALCNYALQCETVFVVEDATKDARFRDNPVVTDGPRVRFYAGCPVSAPDGSRLGTLCVLDTVPRQITPEDIDFMQELGRLIEDELSTLTMASTDALTKLANRRGFDMIAEPMIALCQRAWHPATIVMLDLDGLKQVNDEFGHEAGDSAIKDFATLLLKVFRESDVVARIGGDEFCVLLTDPDDAHPTCPLKRLQQRVDSHNSDRNRPYTLAFSAGVVPFSKKRHASIDDLLRDADERMYSQKRSKKGEEQEIGTE